MYLNYTDTYYSKYVNGSLGKDDKLCFTAGLLAIVKSVNLNELSALNEIIGLYGMTQDMFKEKIKELSSLEVVEIKLGEKLQFSLINACQITCYIMFSLRES